MSEFELFEMFVSLTPDLQQTALANLREILASERQRLDPAETVAEE